MIQIVCQEDLAKEVVLYLLSLNGLLNDDTRDVWEEVNDIKDGVVFY